MPFLGVPYGRLQQRFPALLRNVTGHLTVLGARDRLFHAPLNSRTHPGLRLHRARGRSIDSAVGAHGGMSGGAWEETGRETGSQGWGGIRCYPGKPHMSCIDGMSAGQ
ncbi:hypothetical protein GCM10018980_62440 [Streptomyces capoamus]|uniref:Uncharacterized protein n=1 Tax=Streptomyces capoamus TaxID=68183 RepID=A0A919F1S8_9ACTN|nr:hypothetical protein GCM10010501_24610 [Streptomyces libani subsp. rufus]GHG68716.1 hypothetical protein GCM10018980_62440 [Streptomyces capoamus]